VRGFRNLARYCIFYVEAANDIPTISQVFTRCKACSNNLFGPSNEILAPAKAEGYNEPTAIRQHRMRARSECRSIHGIETSVVDDYSNKDAWAYPLIK